MTSSSALGRTWSTAYGSSGADRSISVVVETFLDQLLARHLSGGVEAAVVEELLVLEVHVVLAAAILLDGGDHPVPVPLCLVWIELDVHLGDDVVLLVLVARLGDDGHLLEVVEEQDEPLQLVAALMLGDCFAQRVDR